MPTAGSTPAAPRSQADIEALRNDPPDWCGPLPARLVAGLAARRRAGAGPFALVPCDNTPGNGALAERVVRDLAELVGCRVWSGGWSSRWPS